MKTICVVISSKDHVGAYAILIPPPDNKGIKIHDLFRTWKQGTLEAYLAAHPALWDEECDEIMRSSRNPELMRKSLLRDIVGDARDYPYDSYDKEADGFIEWLIEWLIETHGFEKAGKECVEFDMKFDRD